jgi:hypothetical protein
MYKYGIYIYIYGKCLGFARTRNDDRQRIIIIIIVIIIMIVVIMIIMVIMVTMIIITIIIIIIKALLKIFSECRSLTRMGELNPY